MDNMENMEAEDIYYVEILNNKRFKGVYVNKNAILEQESINDGYSITETDKLIAEIKKLNISKELKMHLLRRELEMFRLKSELKYLKIDFEILKRDLLGSENDVVDTDEVIDED